ncbi:MAG: metallophosphoesterase family protein [Desulfobulbaceae bacterium]|nr:metallophosphoesterase family protein [Desulfobulbaceae bacterium]
MKVAILADIHGNLEALDAVRADLLQQGADRVICLGGCPRIDNFSQIEAF